MIFSSSQAMVFALIKFTDELRKIACNPVGYTNFVRSGNTLYRTSWLECMFMFYHTCCWSVALKMCIVIIYNSYVFYLSCFRACCLEWNVRLFDYRLLYIVASNLAQRCKTLPRIEPINHRNVGEFIIASYGCVGRQPNVNHSHGLICQFVPNEMKLSEGVAGGHLNKGY